MPRLEKSGIKCYTPDEDLVNHLKRQLRKKKATKSGVELEVNDGRKRKRDDLDRMKVYYLDNHIFPAMANLAFFFEAMAKHTELEEVFEDNIKDLLGIRRNKAAKQVYGFMFFNLLRNILKASNLHLEKKEDIPRDFRLILNHDAMRIVRNKVSALLAGGYEKKNDIVMLVDNKKENVRKVILDDFTRALAWTGSFASGLDPDSVDDEEPHRTFDFDTEKLLK